MTIFSSDVFLRTVGEVFFQDHRSAPAQFTVDGRIYRLLEVDGAPVTRAPFVDFFEPVTAFEGRARPLGYLPRVARETVSAEDWLARPSAPRLLPSPFIVWSRFDRWESFAAHVASRCGNLFPDSRRRRNKLCRALGDVQLRLDDRRPATLDLGMKWKSAQYLASGYEDLFADARNRRLFAELQARGQVLVSSLSAGDQIIAVHLGASHGGRLYWWVPSYAPELARFSPGRLLLESLIQASFERGDEVFDFLIGDEAYKWHYATHTRVIGDAGRPPASVRAKAELKLRVKQALRGAPWLLARFPWLERRVAR
jgi:CelD/BcsL family acetyltransferase involved in cellulose biosynthesis